MYIASMTDGSLINLMFALMFCQQQYVSFMLIGNPQKIPIVSMDWALYLQTVRSSFTKFNEHELN